MYILFERLKGSFKIRRFNIDNCAFRLHYKVTTPLLFIFSILVTAEKIIERPIECMKTDNIPVDLLNAFCWVHPTFSIQDSWNKEVGEEVPYPGVDKYVPGKKRIFHAYYQWVGLALFFQSLLFYVPHYIWKTMESHKIEHLTEGLLNPRESKKETVENLVNYLVVSRKQHYWYYAGYFFTEILNLLNVAGQGFLMDKFFAGEFRNLGRIMTEFTQWDSAVSFDPLVKVFPRVTKCTFHQYGSSGNVQRHDTLCVLPLNIYNEKIYIFLWFWFTVLIFITALIVTYRALLSAFPPFRRFIFRQSLWFVDEVQTKAVLENAGCGDWLVLDLLRRNLDPICYRDVIYRLYRSLNEKNANSV